MSSKGGLADPCGCFNRPFCMNVRVPRWWLQSGSIQVKKTTKSVKDTGECLNVARTPTRIPPQNSIAGSCKVFFASIRRIEQSHLDAQIWSQHFEK